MKHDDISKSLVETIENPELENLIINQNEIFFDTITNATGIIKDIPVFKTISDMIKIGISIKDNIFIKKLYNFLFHLKDVPRNKRLKLRTKLRNDSKHEYDVGKNIIILLERFDDYQKPEIMAKAFIAYLDEKITSDQLLKINYGIDHLYIGDIKSFFCFYRNPKHSLEESSRRNFTLHGFSDSMNMYGPNTSIEINDLGTLFAEHVLSEVYN